MPRGEAPHIDWREVAGRLVKPVKMAILDVLAVAKRPLSPVEMVRLFDDADYYLSLVSHHARSLEAAGILVLVDTRKVRGAREHFYAIHDDLLTR